MNPPETNDPIEQLLREQDGYVPDDGFSKRVVARLPRRRGWLPRVVLLAAVVIGAVFAVYWLPWKNLPPLDYTKIISLDPKVWSTWLPFVAVIVALASGLHTALRRED
jgi:Domain of unknown function (DUF5056)